jgi:outer membrane protein assembly factor BamB
MQQLTHLARVTVIFVAGIHSLSAADWNEWRGPGRNGAATDSPSLLKELPPDGLKPVWVSESIKSAGEGGWGSPVVANGRVYLFAHAREQVRELDPPKYPALSEQQQQQRTPVERADYERERAAEEKERRALQFRYREFLHCIDASGGEALWTNRSDSLYTQFPQSGSPTVVGDKLYILGAGRRLRCIDVARGDDVWNTHLPGEFEDQFFQSSVAVIDGVVVATADRLFGVDAGSGKILWESTPEQVGMNNSSPAAWDCSAGRMAICNLDGGWTACFDPRTGRELWRVKSEASIATPVVQGDRLITYGSTRKAGLRCFQLMPDTATESWVYHGIADNGGSPVVVGRHVYVQGGDRLACVDVESGKAEWTASLDLHNPQYTSLLAANGKVFYAYESLICWEAEPSEFRLLYDGRFAKSREVATLDRFRGKLAPAESAPESTGAEEVEELLAEHLGNPPLGCASPAFADGRIYLRLHDCVACYDLRQTSIVASSAE